MLLGFLIRRHYGPLVRYIVGKDISYKDYPVARKGKSTLLNLFPGDALVEGNNKKGNCQSKR